MLLYLFPTYLCLVITLVTIATAVNNCERFSTFNAGLILTVPEADSRKPEIIRALNNSTADVVCLQEVWYEKDMTDILQGVRSLYPHHYSSIHYLPDQLKEPVVCQNGTLEKETPCTIKEAVRFGSRLERCGNRYGCFNLTGVARFFCLPIKCGKYMKCRLTKPSCITCVVANSLVSLDYALTECTMQKRVDNRQNPPGLLMLSKRKLTDASYTSYFPQNRMLIQRGYLQAKTDGGKLAACTHLTAIFSPYPEYDLPFGNYLNQSKAEILVLGNALSGRKHVLMGDFNTGPTVTGQADPKKNVDGEYPENYDLLTSFGYSSPYLEQDGRCTFCGANPLTFLNKSIVIDQIMVKNGTFSTHSAQRVFDKVNPPLSDHFGVQVDICDP